MKKQKHIFLSAQSISKTVSEAMWSDRVQTSWHPKSGFFTQSASEIANGLKGNSKDLEQSMSRLNFYINRTGDNLPSSRKTELEKAKTILRSLYPKKPS